MASNEEVDLVDEHDEPSGLATLGECLARGLLHRAVAVLVVRSTGMFLLQQRNKRDLWHPGLWTLSSTGHVGKGESYQQAARRELDEELGLAAEIRLLKKRLMPPIRFTRLTEHEWVAFYLARSDLPCTIDPVELEQVGEFSEDQTKRLMEGGSMTPDAVILLRDYFGQGKSGARL